MKQDKRIKKLEKEELDKGKMIDIDLGDACGAG